MQIKTKRLTLRPPAAADAARIAVLAGDYDIAAMTAVIPHPYSETMAAAWIEDALQGEEGVVFMIDFKGALIGCAGYRAFGADYGELGYWIGKPYWGVGFASEAARALIAHAFDVESFSYLIARHFTGNAASAAIVAKLGFSWEGEHQRVCEARGETLPCASYRLDRDRAEALFRRA